MYKSVLYFATVTLHPKLYKNTISEQYDKTNLLIALLMKQIRTSSTIVAEQTKSWNLHYHIVIQFNVRSKNHIKDFYDLFRGSGVFGFVNIKQIEDDAGIRKYISKSLSEFKDCVGRPPVLLDELNFMDLESNLFLVADLIDEQ